MANKEQRRGNREKKKPKQIKKEGPAKASIFAAPPAGNPGNKSK